MPLNTDKWLVVSEIFGITLQGEGRNQGKPCSFIRLGLCNLDCRWCDTPFTWDWTGKNGYAYSKAIETRKMALSEIADALPKECKRIVISGGEPMLQQKTLLNLVSLLGEQNYFCEIETNGTLTPLDDWQRFTTTQFNVSPKLAHSGVSAEKAIKIDALKEYDRLDSSFKFVVKDAQDLTEIDRIVDAVGIDSNKIWLMPEGRSSADIIASIKWVFDECAKRGWNLTPRFQVLAHNDKRKI